MSSFVLIPGAGGEAWYWDPVLPLLRDAGHDVVAVDLPADDDTADLAAYADVAVRAAAPHPAPYVVVGHSMGALTAPLVAVRLGAAAIVLLAPMIPAPGETGDEWWRASGQREAQRAADVAAGRDPDRPFDEVELFLHDVPAGFLDGAPQPRDQSSTPFAEPWPLAAWPDVPTRVIACARDRLFPARFIRAHARERLGPDVPVDVVDAGHMAMSAAPGELAALLVACAAEAAAAPVSAGGAGRA